MAAIYPDLEGKTVYVTGGASGIGKAIVQAFAAQKSQVVFFDVDVQSGEKLAAELNQQRQTVHFIRLDLRDVEALQIAFAQAKEKWGAANILINNAAHDERHPTGEVTSAYWDERIAVNLKHQFFASQAVLPDFMSANQGVIINFGSTTWLAGQGGMAVYSASKSAVLGLTRSLARDYGSYNVRVNAIAPGWIMTERQIEKWLTPESEQELMNRQCLKRKLTPSELARFTVFLASEEASACTAQHYIVDGGWV